MPSTGLCSRDEEARVIPVDRIVSASGSAGTIGASRDRGACSLVITGTGFSREERDALRHAATQQLGGRYLADLVHRTTAPQCFTTLLVCKTFLDAFGTAKYTRAVEWGLPVVHWSWVRDSVQQGALQPYERYKTDTMPSSTSTSSSSSSSRRVFAELGNLKGARGCSHTEQHSLKPAHPQPQPQAPQMFPGSQVSPSLCSSAGVSVHSQLSLSYLLQQQRGREAGALLQGSSQQQQPRGCSSPEFRLQPQPAARTSLNGSDSAASTPGFKPHVKQAAADRPASTSPPGGSFQAAPWTHSGSAAPPPQPVGFQGAAALPSPHGVTMSPLPDLEIASPSFGSPCRRNSAPSPATAADAAPDDDEALEPCSETHDDMEGTEGDDLIIPGTQALDDDDDASSPQSLLTYLRTRMTISGMSDATGQSKAEALCSATGPAAQSVEHQTLVSRVGLPGGRQVEGWQQRWQQQVHEAPHHPAVLLDHAPAPLPTPAKAQREGEANGPEAMEVSPAPQPMHSRMDTSMEVSPLPARHSPDFGERASAACMLGVSAQMDQAAVLYSLAGFTSDVGGGAAAAVPRGLADAHSQAGAPVPQLQLPSEEPAPPHAAAAAAAQVHMADMADTLYHPGPTPETAGHRPTVPPAPVPPAPAFVPPNGPLSSFIKAEPRHHAHGLGSAGVGEGARGRARGQEPRSSSRSASASAATEAVIEAGAFGARGSSHLGAHTSSTSAASRNTSTGSVSEHTSRVGSGQQGHHTSGAVSTSALAELERCIKPEPEGAAEGSAIGPVGVGELDEDEDWLGSCDADTMPSFSFDLRSETLQQQQQQQRPLRRLQRGSDAIGAAAARSQPEEPSAGQAARPEPSSSMPAASVAPAEPCLSAPSSEPAAAAVGAVRVKLEATSAVPAGPQAAVSSSVAAKALASARAARNSAASSCSAGAARPAPASRGAASGSGLSAAAADTQQTPVGLLQQMLQEAEAAASAGDPLGGAGGASASGGSDVVVVKPLARYPRGTSAKEYHRLPNLKGLDFAEQVKIPALGLTITCKDRSKRTTCPLLVLKTGGTGATEQASDTPEVQAVLVEPYAVYCMQGDMWMEFHPMITLQHVRKQAQASQGATVAVPELVQSHEVLRVLQRQHAKLSSVCGAFDVVRTKKLPPRLAPGTLYQRFTWDADTSQVLTDAPASDFVLA